MVGAPLKPTLFHFSGRASLLAVLCIGGLLGACSKGRGGLAPDEQTRGMLNIPGGEPVSLSLADDSGKDRHFNGWFIVWDPAATSQVMARVLKATVDFHRAYATHLRWYADTIRPLRAQTDRLEAHRDEIVGEMNRNLRPNRLTLARAWFGEQQKESRLALSEADQVQSSKVFGTFCEAKLWEFATNRELISRRYTSRPTPAALCESYYSETGLLDSNAASCAVDAQPKDFFACLWKEGVLKTAAMGRAKDFLALSALDPQVVKDSILTRLISQSILRQARAVRIGDRMFDLSFVGQKTISDGDATIEALVPTGVLQIFAIDHLTDVPSDSIRLVSLAAPREEATLKAIEEWRKDIGIFSADINDREFNRPVSGVGSDGVSFAGTSQENAAGQCIAAGGAGVCSILAVVDSEAQADLDRTKSELADIKARITDLTTKADRPCGDDVATDSLQCREEQASLRLSEAVTAPQTTIVMLPLQRFGLSAVHMDGAPMLRVGFSQTSPRVPLLSGCIDGNEGALAPAAPCTLADNRLLVTRPVASELNIETTGFFPFEAFGLSKQLRTNDPHFPEFVEIPDSFGSEGRIKFELVANRWEEVLDILSGPVTITNGSKDDPLNGVALLLDADVNKESVSIGSASSK